MRPVVTATDYPDLKCLSRGKVRDIYDLGDHLLIVVTDRISAFDFVLPNGIPDKGRVLNLLSAFWLERTRDIVANHLRSVDPADLPASARPHVAELEGRFTIARKARMLPVECIVRGYLSGSGYKDYQRNGSVCGIALPPGLRESDRLPEPLFTPSTKAETGHDENISFETMCGLVGRELSERLRELSLSIYRQGAEYARTRGILIADTKFEFGRIGDELILIDEVLTPDSSRFWPQDLYQPGQGQPSFDKQYVRDWLETTGWDKNSPPPELPADVVRQTRAKYIEAYERLAQRMFEWK